MREEEAGGDEEQARALVEVLRSVRHPEHVWREQLNARWVVFVGHEEQTYCLLPLLYEAPVLEEQEDERAADPPEHAWVPEAQESVAEPDRAEVVGRQAPGGRA